MYHHFLIFVYTEKSSGFYGQEIGIYWVRVVITRETSFLASRLLLQYVILWHILVFLSNLFLNMLLNIVLLRNNQCRFLWVLLAAAVSLTQSPH